ncbi:MAG TPA: T9SS type A sorting domain-containing protein [Bacteroidales bacterium]|nr:T9SS type A sorting domain-containing protein [Bacteroidales bacterium]
MIKKHVKYLAVFFLAIVLNKAFAFENSFIHNVSKCSSDYILPEGSEDKGKIGDLGICKVESPVSEYCGHDTLTPSVWIKNYSDFDVDSFSVLYRLDHYPINSKTISEVLPAGDSVLINFGPLMINSGNHAIFFHCSILGETPDQNTINNSIGFSFNYSFGKQVQISVFTDSFGYETSWVLKNSNDLIIAQGDNFESNSLYQEILCLVQGCYTFTIYDEYGDGICCTYGEGYYLIENLSDNVEIDNGGEFATSESVEFCIDNDIGAPVAGFIKSDVNNCTGEVRFFDYSICNPPATEWLWDFGDGHTSTEQNPVNTYLMNGYYDVSLQITNEHGTSFLQVPSFIEISRPDPPFIADKYFCNPGETIVFHAPQGYGDVNWYIDPASDVPELIYNSFTLENLLADSTIYYQYVANNESQHVGITDNSGVGGYFNFSIDRAVYFDAYCDLTIKTAKVFASGTAERTITLKNSGGEILDTRTLNISDGESIIEINFQIDEGEDYAIHVNLSNNLSYSGDYGGPNIGYPFTVPDLISFTGNNYSESFWYFFYDIEVMEGFDSICASAITPLHAFLSQPSFELGNDTTICYGTDIVLSPDNEFAEYHWSNDCNTYAISVQEPGTYILTVTDAHSCTASNSVSIENFEQLIYSVIIENFTGFQLGSISVDIVSGAQPVCIIWDDQTTDFTMSELSYGVYYFTLTDANGCEYNDSATVADVGYISPLSLFNNVLVYPNPVDSQLIIESLENKCLIIQMFDISGRVVKTINTAETKTKIDMSDLNTGTYFINIIDSKQKYRYKVVKQ